MVCKDGLLVCESGPDKQYGYLATRNITTILTFPWNLNRKKMVILAYLFVPL